MTVAAGLLDSNVIIAALAGAHEHHVASIALFTAGSPVAYAVAAHSIAEAYATLTRRGEHAPFRFTAEEAWAALESLRAATALIDLTPAQTFDTVRTYAAEGGIGARLYDALIGQTALTHGIPAIVTWNTRHMAGLFPQIDVMTPKAFLGRPHA